MKRTPSRIRIVATAGVLAIVSLLVGPAEPVFGQSTPDQRANDPLRGHTIRWTWTDGPTAGVTHEHVFHEDGTVEWKVKSGPQKGHNAREKEYAVLKVAEDIYVVSYLAASGYTLTVALNFRDGSMVGIASGHGQWFPASGTFEVVDQ